MTREKAAKLYLAVLWAVCVYRAATQSIVHDEALTYQLYLKGPFSALFQVFSANHHFLNTILMYWCSRLFGFSELSLRLGALAGAAIYFSAVYRLCRRAFGQQPMFLPAIALVTLHPLILDFMVAARGYGMALGLWLWSLELLASDLEKPGASSPRRLIAAALTLSLSVVANLIFVVPAVVLAAMVVGQVSDLPRRSRYFLMPIIVAAVVFALVSPLRSATGANFYAGAATAADSARSLARVTVAHARSWRDGPYTELARDAVAFALAPAILLCGALFCRSFFGRLCFAIAGGSALLLWILHHTLHMLYPEDRTGIYFLPLLSLILAALADGSAPKAITRAANAVMIALLILFLAQWNVRKFFVWEYDADTREIGSRITAQIANPRPDSVRIGISWALEPSLNFYREQRGWTWMVAPTRAPLAPGFDYYAIIAIDRAEIARLRLQPEFEGQASGTVLAVPLR